MGTLEQIIQALMSVCLALIFAIVCIRFQWLRTALNNINDHWSYKLKVAVLFGLLAAFSTHSGVIVNIDQVSFRPSCNYLDTFRTHALGKSEAVVSFRDGMVLFAGMLGGVWVGLGAGIIAGLDRFLSGGFISLPAGTATVIIGVYAGYMKDRHLPWKWCHSALGKTLFIAFTGCLLQRFLILSISGFSTAAITLSKQIGVAMLVINVTLCMLLRLIERDLERDELKKLAIQAELSALRAQVEPHFLNNTLGVIKRLVDSDPPKAKKSIVNLAEFFSNTLQPAKDNLITLEQALYQTHCYIDIQNLRLEQPLIYHEQVSETLKPCLVPNFCLLNLVENAFSHGFDGHPYPYQLTISATEHLDSFVIRVIDNGAGIQPERLLEIGKQVVKSDSHGIALHNLNRTLLLLFGPQAALAFNSKPGVETAVNITLPKRVVA